MHQFLRLWCWLDRAVVAHFKFLLRWDLSEEVKAHDKKLFPFDRVTRIFGSFGLLRIWFMASQLPDH
jgi:hypothetical protein